MLLQPSPLEIRLRQSFPEAATARIDRVGMLSDVQRESVWQHLRALHCDVKWIEDEEFDSYLADHWQPVIARRGDGEYLFMDRTGVRTLMFRSPAT
mgnify:FL=1